MNTSLAQLITLTAHGNLTLNHPDGPRQVNLVDQPVFRFVGELGFTLEPGEAGEKARVVARSPEDWYAFLHQSGVRRLWLTRTQGEGRSILPAHHAVAFAGGEPGGIIAALPDGTTKLWVPRWQLGDRDAPHQRIWDVEYRAIPGPPIASQPELSLDQAGDALHTALVEIAQFAAEQDLDSWVPHFESADSILTGSDAPETMGLFPSTGYSPAARRLLGAATSAWVFGGMGSWNDTGPRDADQQPRYDRLSAALFDGIMNGLVASANSHVTRESE